MRKILIVGAVLILSFSARAQNYSIDWFTIAGGGGTSSGSNYSVSGTIGQPATATLSGGNFSLTGGFWSLISAVQTPGAPLLTITQSGANATISWPLTAGFALQNSQILTSSSWAAATGTLVTNAGIVSLTVPATSGYRFYRLTSGN